MLENFEDAVDGGFYFTGHGHESLIYRAKPGHDQATPCGNGVAAESLLRLGHLLGEPRYLRAAQRTLDAFRASMAANPAGMATLCASAHQWQHPEPIVVLRGPGARAWFERLSRRATGAVLVLHPDDHLEGLPGVLDKPVPSVVNAWVCQGVSCLAPLDTYEALVGVLDAL